MWENITPLSVVFWENVPKNLFLPHLPRLTQNPKLNINTNYSVLVFLFINPFILELPSIN